MDGKEWCGGTEGHCRVVEDLLLCQSPRSTSHEATPWRIWSNDTWRLDWLARIRWGRSRMHQPFGQSFTARQRMEANGRFKEELGSLPGRKSISRRWWNRIGHDLAGEHCHGEQPADWANPPHPLRGRCNAARRSRATLSEQWWRQSSHPTN